MRWMSWHLTCAGVLCRGLTLSEEHRQITTVARQPEQGASTVARLMQMVRPEVVHVESHSHCEVSQSTIPVS